jgi:hypothetical protein
LRHSKAHFGLYKPVNKSPNSSHSQQLNLQSKNQLPTSKTPKKIQPKNDTSTNATNHGATGEQQKRGTEKPTIGQHWHRSNGGQENAN